MSHGRSQHPNAPLTPEGRRRMVGCVVEQGWSVAATAERFQVDPKTVRKWRDRFLAEGLAVKSRVWINAPRVSCLEKGCGVQGVGKSVGRDGERCPFELDFLATCHGPTAECKYQDTKKVDTVRNAMILHSYTSHEAFNERSDGFILGHVPLTRHPAAAILHILPVPTCFLRESLWVFRSLLL